MVELALKPERIAIVQTAYLGDLLSTSPLVRVARLAWPKAHLSVVTRPRLAPVAALIPGVDAAVPFDKDGADRGLVGLRRVARALGGPELVLVPHPSLRSALLARLSGAAARVGTPGRLRGRLLTHKVELREREPFVERAMDLARSLGVEGPTGLVLTPPAEARAKSRAVLGEAPSVGLIVGSARATKRWPAESLAALADRADEAGLRPVLLGGPAEKPIAAAVLAAVQRARPLDLVGEPLVESIAALSCMRGAVGGDTGLAHAARAVGTPTLLLFGPTDPGLHLLEPHAGALRLGLDCQPCHAYGPKRCPLGHHGCMAGLEPDRVWDAFANLLARGGVR